MKDCCAAALYAFDVPSECPDCGEPLRGLSEFANQLDKETRRKPGKRDREASWDDRQDDYYDGRDVS